MCINKFD